MAVSTAAGPREAGGAAREAGDPRAPARLLASRRRQDFELLASLYTPTAPTITGLYCGPAAGYVRVAARRDEGRGPHHPSGAQRRSPSTGGARRQRCTSPLQPPARLGRRLRGAGPGPALPRPLPRGRGLPGASSTAASVVDWAQHGPAFWGVSHPLLDGKRSGLAGGEDRRIGFLRTRSSRAGAERAAATRRRRDEEEIALDASTQRSR